MIKKIQGPRPETLAKVQKVRDAVAAGTPVQDALKANKLGTQAWYAYRNDGQAVKQKKRKYTKRTKALEYLDVSMPHTVPTQTGAGSGMCIIVACDVSLAGQLLTQLRGQ